MTLPSRSRRDAPQAAPASGRRRACPLAFAILLCAAFGVLLASTPAAAQSKPKPYALIFGTVFEADGHLAYAVPVKIRRADQKKVLDEGMSDHAGEFAFRVPPGPADYVVWADLKPRKKRAKQQGDKNLPPAAGQASGLEVRVHVDNEERVDISLHLTE